MKNALVLAVLLAIMPLAAFRAAPATIPAAAAVPYKYQGTAVRVDLRRPVPAPHWKKSTTKTSGPEIALWQEGCYQNTAYFIWFDVNGQWRDTFTTYAAGLRATLFYLWCTRWPGDGTGLNFTGTTVSSIGGADSVIVGSSIGGVVHQPLQGVVLLNGAYTYDNSWFAPDGLPPDTSVWIAPGSSFTDWSLPLSGAGNHEGCFTGWIYPGDLYVCTPYPA